MNPEAAFILGTAIFIAVLIGALVIGDAIKAAIPREITFTHAGTARQIHLTQAEWEKEKAAQVTAEGAK